MFCLLLSSTFCHQIYRALYATSLLITKNANAFQVQSILFDDMELFYENASPLLGIGDDGNLMKGLFGMRLASVKRTLVRKNKMNNFQTLGPAALTPEDVRNFVAYR